jgi:uncharacterized protein with HEPN domain
LPSEKPARRLEDIIDNAQAIQRYIAGMDLAAFGKKLKTNEKCMPRGFQHTRDRLRFLFGEAGNRVMQ